MNVEELLSSPERWTQGTMARSAGGGRVSPHSGYAVAWCLVGAIKRCYTDPTPAINKVARSLRDREVVQPDGWIETNITTVLWWNDHRERTWQDVIRLVKRLEI